MNETMWDKLLPVIMTLVGLSLLVLMLSLAIVILGIVPAPCK